jgi:hypothetical protein
MRGRASLYESGCGGWWSTPSLPRVCEWLRLCPGDMVVLVYSVVICGMVGGVDMCALLLSVQIRMLAVTGRERRILRGARRTVSVQMSNRLYI